MSRKKALKVGDEVVVISGRRHVAFPARISRVQEVHPRGIYIEGTTQFLGKTSVARRSPTAERLGLRIDLLDKLEDERQDMIHRVSAPINEKYAELMEPVRAEIRELYRDVENEQ